MMGDGGVCFPYVTRLRRDGHGVLIQFDICHQHPCDRQTLTNAMCIWLSALQLKYPTVEVDVVEVQEQTLSM
jgi:hypothetical protein